MKIINRGNIEKKTKVRWVNPVMNGIWFLQIGGVIVASLTPSRHMPDISIKGMTAHTIAYLILSGWSMIVFRSPLSQVRAALSLLVLGIVMEVIQLFVPGRAFEMADIFANTLGIVLGYLLGRLLFRRFSRI